MEEGVVEEVRQFLQNNINTKNKNKEKKEKTNSRMNVPEERPREEGGVPEEAEREELLALVGASFSLPLTDPGPLDEEEREEGEEEEGD